MRHPVRVLFFYQTATNWLNMDAMYRAMLHDERFQVHIWTVSSSLEGPHVRPNVEPLKELNYHFVYGDTLTLTKNMFDVAIIASPYDGPRAVEFSTAHIKTLVPHIVYVPYGLEIGGGEANKVNQYGLAAHTLASAIFVRSQNSKDMYKQFCPTGDKHVYVTGVPRLDNLYKLDQFAVDPELKEQVNGRFSVLWNSHFSFDANRWSTFDIMAEDLLFFAAQNPDIAFIWRPHPALAYSLISLKMLDINEYNVLINEIRELGIIVDLKDDHRHAFAISNCLLTDAGSFFLEYLTTLKPILYLKNEHGLGLNPDGEKLAKIYEQATTPEQAIDFIERIKKGKDKFKKAREQALPFFIYGFDGQAGQRAAEQIYLIAQK